MRTILIIWLCWSAGLEAQTFDRSCGQAWPWEEYTAANSQEVDGIYYSLYRHKRENGYEAYLRLQATDMNGDTLFTRSLRDDYHPFAAYGLEKSLTTTDLFGSGFKQIYDTLEQVRSFLVRYNTMGETLWYHEYVNSEPAYNILIGRGLYVDAEDGLAQWGFTINDPIFPYNDEPAQIYLMKCDAQGTRVWDRVYGDPLINETPQDLIGLPDTGYLIVGHVFDYISFFPLEYEIHSFLLRTDDTGNEQFMTYLPGDQLSLTSITSTSDGNYLLCGTWCPNSIDSCGGVFIKVDEDANVLWQRAYYPGGDTVGISVFEDVMELEDGSFVAAGRSRPELNGQDAGWVVKVDGAGYQLWNRVIDKTPAYDSFTRITACSDGGILLTGQMQRDQLSDVWLVKLDSNGCDSAGCPQDIHTGVPPIVTSGEVEKSAVLAAMPNPFSGSTVLRYSVPDHCGPPTSRGETHVTLDVRDALGRVVRTERLPGATGDYTFSGGEMRAGVYSATLLCASVPCATVCLVVER